MKDIKYRYRFAVRLVATLAMAAMMLRTGLGMQRNAYPPFENFASGRVMNSSGSLFKHNAEIMFGKDPPADKWQGFVKFDLSEIPDNAVITSVSMFYNVISVSRPGPWTEIRHISVDPVSSTPELLWDEIRSGLLVTDIPVQEVKGWVERPFNAAGVAAVQAALSGDWVAFGFYKFDEDETKGHVKGYQAGPHKPYLKVTFAGRDIGIDQISSPVGAVLQSSPVEPAVMLTNYGDVDGPFQLVFEISDAGNQLYREEITVTGLSPGQSQAVALPQWIASGSGERVARAQVFAEFDNNPANDIAAEWFQVVAGGGGGNGNGNGQPPSIRWGWEETRSVPAGSSNRPVRQGGWLTVDPATGLVYSGKGNKTGDLAVFDPIARRWTELASIPEGPSGRLPGNGTSAIAGGDGYIYLVKGRGTSEFWRYSIADNIWEQLPDVPFGPSNRHVKKGSAMAWVAQYGSGYVYLLRGPNNDFLRYDTEAQAWENLSPAPIGQSRKWSYGSWLAFDGGSAIYAHKPKKNELWRYDLAADNWSPASLPGIPLLAQASQVRKAADGSSGAFKKGVLHALKGNKTGEFWRFDPAAGDWRELEPMPADGSTGRIVRVHQGGALVDYPFGRTFYALKGNKTLEFWRYTMAPEGSLNRAVPVPAQQTAGTVPARRASLTVLGNPVPGRMAMLSYSLPSQGMATLAVYDPAGRLVRSISRELEQSGFIQLDVGGMNSGAYVIRLASAEYTAATRLVIGTARPTQR